ncbi:hypothetical protein KI387_021278, partial [Taxus chinensis]
ALEKFKDEDGQFFCCFGPGQAHKELPSMLNLYRASELDFPVESILKEARAFTSTYLHEVMKDWEEVKFEENQLFMEASTSRFPSIMLTHNHIATKIIIVVLHLKETPIVQWERYILSYLQEAEWIASNYTPSFDQYLANGIMSSGVRFITMHSMVLMDTLLSDDILRKLDFPVSKFQSLMTMAARLIDDMQDFE